MTNGVNSVNIWQTSSCSFIFITVLGIPYVISLAVRNGLIVGIVVFGLFQLEILTHLGQVIKC